MLFPRELLYRLSYYSEVLSEYAKKKSGGLEKSEVWNAWSLIVPLSSNISFVMTVSV